MSKFIAITAIKPTGDERKYDLLIRKKSIDHIAQDENYVKVTLRNGSWYKAKEDIGYFRRALGLI